MDSSSSTKNFNTKLCVRKQTLFKKSAVSSNDIKKKTNLIMREHTIFNKASELLTLCDIEVCVIYYDRDGGLVRTWPEDQSKVRDMAERFHKLSHEDKQRKSTNLSQCLNKKIKEDMKQSLTNKDNKFSKKLIEMENSLETRLRMFQEKLRVLNQSYQSRDFFTTNQSCQLIEDHHHQQWTEPWMNHLSHGFDFDPLIDVINYQQ